MKPRSRRFLVGSTPCNQSMKPVTFNGIKERSSRLLQTKNLADCVFLVGSTPCNQKMIAGHKLILATASPVFECMFYGQLAEKDDPIVIPDVQPNIFETVLQYIYSDSIYISSIGKAFELYYVAKKYMLPDLVKQCTTFLLSNKTAENACRCYEFAKFYGEHCLIESSMTLIAHRTQEVLADPGFTGIEISTLMAILDQDILNIPSELNLFNALLRFANKRMVRNESLPDAGQNNEQISSESAIRENGETLLQFDKMKSASSPGDLVVGDDTSVADDSANKVAFPVSYDQPPTSVALVAANAQNLNNYLMETQHSVLDEDMLKKAIKKIRFLNMTPLEFAEGPARSKLLQQHDALAILINILSPHIKDCPMPEGFCSSRTSRWSYKFEHSYSNSDSTSHSD